MKKRNLTPVVCVGALLLSGCGGSHGGSDGSIGTITIDGVTQPLTIFEGDRETGKSPGTCDFGEGNYLMWPLAGDLMTPDGLALNVGDMREMSGGWNANIKDGPGDDAGWVWRVAVDREDDPPPATIETNGNRFVIEGIWTRRGDESITAQISVDVTCPNK